jgi:hypothetical protein
MSQSAKYYSTNAVLETLSKSPGDFVWPAGNSWILVYALQTEVPVAVVFVRGQSVSENAVANYARQLAERAGLPFLSVEFDDTSSEISEVQVFDSDKRVRVPLPELKQRFEKLGLPVTSGAVTKAVNDKESSAYHHWQREELGAIKVTDIDLLRVVDTEIVEVLELKRSFFSLETWRPYKADYTNFNVIANVCEPAGVRFTIAYNVRTTNPTRDDPSRLSLFAYDSQSKVSPIGLLSFDDFAAGKY